LPSLLTAPAERADEIFLEGARAHLLFRAVVWFSAFFVMTESFNEPSENKMICRERSKQLRELFQRRNSREGSGDIAGAEESKRTWQRVDGLNSWEAG